jgi:hypothetical protein
MVYLDIPKLKVWLADTYAFRSKPNSNPLLNGVDNELMMYEQATQAMSRRSLLTSMLIYLRFWRSDLGKGVFCPAADALERVIQSKLPCSTGPHKYTRVICIGWPVPCGAGSGYYSTSPNDRMDMQNKCYEMLSAIALADQLLGIVPEFAKDPLHPTLKIFMAPEFYFRGSHGAYSLEVASDILPTLKQGLVGAKGTDDADYDDWLFIFGTVASAFEQEQGGTAEIYNTALIQKGSDTHQVVKESISTIDYKPSGGKVKLSVGKPALDKNLTVKEPRGAARSVIQSRFEDERMGGGIFTIDGITFGLEICLDHEASAGSDRQWTATGVNPKLGRLAPYGDLIQVLLIPSFGMKIGTNLYCMDEGIVFNVDGSRPGTEVQIRNGSDPMPGARRAGLSGVRGVLDAYGPFELPYLQDRLNLLQTPPTLPGKLNAAWPPPSAGPTSGAKTLPSKLNRVWPPPK